jgi:hypothetical protein
MNDSNHSLPEGEEDSGAVEDVEDAEDIEALEPLPWDASLGGPLAAFRASLVGFLLHPLSFFRRVPHSEDRWPALGYALVMHVFGFGAAAAWLAIIEPAELTLALIRVVIAPLWVLVSVWGGAELMHGVLSLLKGARFSRSVTHRAVAYCYSTAILGFIPVHGLRLGLLAAAVYQVIALRQAHRAPTWKALLAVLVTWGLVVGAVVIMAVSSGVSEEGLE